MANQFGSSGGGYDQGASSSSCKRRRRSTESEHYGKWWENCTNPNFTESEFRTEFRMSRSTLNFISEELKLVLKRNDSVSREKWVAICIRRLATGESYQDISDKFGLSVSTCTEAFNNGCLAIVGVLKPKLIQWPNQQETLDKIKTEYNLECEIPNVVGSMYTTQIPASLSKDGKICYLNKHERELDFRWIRIQGVFDFKGVLIDCKIVGPSAISEYEVFEQSELCRKINERQLEGVWIVAKTGFPLVDGILVPYTPFNDRTATETTFNYRIKNIQRVASEAIMRLKGRWFYLRGKKECKLHELPSIIDACCVLHNICETKNEIIDPNLRRDLVHDTEMVPEIRSESASRARDAIVENLVWPPPNAEDFWRTRMEPLLDADI